MDKEKRKKRKKIKKHFAQFIFFDPWKWKLNDSILDAL